VSGPQRRSRTRRRWPHRRLGPPGLCCAPPQPPLPSRREYGQALWSVAPDQCGTGHLRGRLRALGAASRARSGAVMARPGTSWRTRQSARQRFAPARPRGELARSSRHSRRSGPVGRCGLEQMLQAAQAFQIAEKTLVCPLRTPGTGVVASNRHPAATAVAPQRTTQDRQLDSRGPSAAWLRPARPRLDRSAGSRPVTPLARTGAVITVRPHDCRRGGLGAAFGPVALTTAVSP
jgi:hypothetical protein